MKKKCLLPLLCLALSLTLLAGCGPTDSTSGAESSTPGSTAQTTAPDKTEATEPENTQAPEATDPTTGPTETDPPATDPTEPPATESPTEPTEPVAPSGNGAAIAAKAESLVGTAFEMGATGPDKFDNSGLIYYCMKENGVDVPRRTLDMYKAGTAVEKDALQPGDVVFFYVDTKGSAQYAGIYIGDNEFVASNNPDSPTCIYNITYPYFTERYVGARRF